MITAKAKCPRCKALGQFDEAGPDMAVCASCRYEFRWRDKEDPGPPTADPPRPAARRRRRYPLVETVVAWVMIVWGTGLAAHALWPSVWVTAMGQVAELDMMGLRLLSMLAGCAMATIGAIQRAGLRIEARMDALADRTEEGRDT